MIKSSILAFVCLLLTNATLNAQNSPVGKFIVSSGIGLYPSYTGTDNTDETPALTFELGYRISPLFSINAHFGYDKVTGPSHFFLDGKQSRTVNETIMIGLKNQVNKSINKYFELYGGALLGYASFKREIIDLSTNEPMEVIIDGPTKINPDAPTGQFLAAGFIGGKIWITPNIGGFVEASSGIAILSMGLSAQF